MSLHSAMSAVSLRDADLTEHQDELEGLAREIERRDVLLAQFAQDQWLDNGRDLLKAKALLAHGSFGSWCKRRLSYSARTAQKLMLAAELYDSWSESESGSYLPKPTAMYALSAPSVPREVQDRFTRRVLAGEDVAVEIRTTLRQMRASHNVPVQSLEAPQSQLTNEAVDVGENSCEPDELSGEEQRQQLALAEALEFLEAHLGSDLPRLLALSVASGGRMLSAEFERGMRERTEASAPHNETVGTEIVAPIGGGAYPSATSLIGSSTTTAGGVSRAGPPYEKAANPEATEPPELLPADEQAARALWDNVASPQRDHQLHPSNGAAISVAALDRAKHEGGRPEGGALQSGAFAEPKCTSASTTKYGNLSEVVKSFPALRGTLTPARSG